MQGKITIDGSITQVTRQSHKFIINNYSFIKDLGVGRWVSSKPFTVGNYSWVIRFYPEGVTPDSREYCTVYTELISKTSKSEEVRCFSDIILFDPSCGSRLFESRGKLHRYRRPNSYISKSCHFKRADLEQHYLKDDKLSFLCKLGVVTSSIQKPSRKKLPVSEIAGHLGAFLESGEDTDITIDVKGQVFHAHKLIMAMRSSVFHTLLVEGPDNVTLVKLEDIEPSIFKKILYYIYRNRLPKDERYYSTKVAQDLFVAADRYGLDQLRAICEAKLCKELKVKTVAATLALADEHHASRLRKACLKFAKSNLKAVERTKGFKCVSPVLQLEIRETDADEEHGHNLWATLKRLLLKAVVYGPWLPLINCCGCCY